MVPITVQGEIKETDKMEYLMIISGIFFYSFHQQSISYDTSLIRLSEAILASNQILFNGESVKIISKESPYTPL